MPEIDYARFVQTASDLARLAGKYAMEYFAGGVKVSFKKGHEAVTEADIKIEKMLKEHLHEAFPAISIAGEELENITVNSELTVYIDPIDGTQNFSRGIPYWCTSIGLLLNEKSAVAGVVYDPSHDELFTAYEGKGAFLNGVKIAIPTPPPLKESFINLDTHPESLVVENPTLLAAHYTLPHRMRFLGSLALECAHVATGRLDLLVGASVGNLKKWDLAGGTAIIKEAGGVCLDLDGNPFNFTQKTFVGGQKKLALAYIKEIKKIKQ